MEPTNYVLRTVPQQDLEEELERREEARLRANLDTERREEDVGEVILGKAPEDDPEEELERREEARLRANLNTERREEDVGEVILARISHRVFPDRRGAARAVVSSGAKLKKGIHRRNVYYVEGSAVLP
jgi:hypothetical protein